MRPRILQKYVTGELLKVFALALVVATGVMFLGSSLQQMHQLNLGPRQLLRLLPFLFSLVIPYTLPVALLFAVTLTYGRLAADNEIVAMEASGINLFWIFLPTILVGLVVSAVAVYVNQGFVPQAHYRVRVLAKDEPEIMVESLLNEHLITDRPVRFGSFRLSFDNYENGLLHKVVLVDVAPEDGISKIFSSEEAQVFIDREKNLLEIDLYKVSWQAVRKDSQGKDEVHSGYAGQLPFQQKLDILSLSREKPKYLTTRELLQRLKETSSPSEQAQAGQVERARILTEVHHRWALGFSCLVFVLVGTPLGIISRWKHPLSAFAFSMLPVLVIYYPLTMGGQALSEEGKLPPVVALWMGNILLFIIGAVLFYGILHHGLPGKGLFSGLAKSSGKRP